MKYIVMTGIKKEAGKISRMKFPFIFPNNLVHAHVAKVQGLLLELMFPQYEWHPTSAGEVNSMDFAGECYGESTTLKLKSKDSDTQLIQMNDYGSSISEV